VDIGTSITDGTTLMAAIGWPTAITALDKGGLPASGGERRVLRLAASPADGIPVDLHDARSLAELGLLGPHIFLRSSGNAAIWSW
jgi:hypothetical protein